MRIKIRAAWYLLLWNVVLFLSKKLSRARGIGDGQDRKAYNVMVYSWTDRKKLRYELHVIDLSQPDFGHLGSGKRIAEGRQ